jgi:NADPH:quinone reductase-like Zn-dependent oxidoreductase
LYINDQTPKPKAEGSKAVVRIKAFGLNRMDIIQRNGVYPLPPQAPKTMGVEFSGTIEELGPDTAKDGESFQVGDEVFGLAYGGENNLAVSANLKWHGMEQLRAYCFSNQKGHMQNTFSSRHTC